MPRCAGQSPAVALTVAYPCKGNAPPPPPHPPCPPCLPQPCNILYPQPEIGIVKFFKPPSLPASRSVVMPKTVSWHLPRHCMHNHHWLGILLLPLYFCTKLSLPTTPQTLSLLTLRSLRDSMLWKVTVTARRMNIRHQAWLYTTHIGSHLLPDKL